MIPFTIDDIYFLMGLSRLGAPNSFSGFTRGGELVRYYIRQFCQEGSQTSRVGNINTRDVEDLPLRTILFTLSKLAGSATLHLENRSYMQYALECLEPKVFNRCETIFSLMKEQLTKVKNGKTKNFSYGSILVSFALERIPLIQPQHISLGVPGPRNPQM